MSLPPEIHNLIFTECIPDKELMAAWGLVSKDYLVPSRSALFSSVRLDSENDAERFAHILDAPSCDIAVLILRLSLSHQSDESPWFPDVLPRLPAFVNATTLCLEASQWGLRDDMCGVLHASLPRATTLEITNFPFVYYADAIHFACGFVQLQSLSFFPRISHENRAVSSVQIPDTLRSLALMCDFDEYPNWFLKHLPLTVTTLRLREIGVQDSHVVRGILTRLGSALESFTAEFTDNVVEADFLQNYSFVQNTGLRRLELTLGRATPIALCLTVLARLTSPVFEELVLDIFIDPPLSKKHRWEALDAAIARGPVRTALRRVELRVGAVSRCAFLENSIPTRMPECAGLGVLRVQVEEVALSHYL